MNDIHTPVDDTKAVEGFGFGDFQIDLVDESLERSGEKLNINRRMFQVLLLLIERAGEIVTKEDFFEKVWAESFVEDNNLTVAITALRKILGDDAKQPKFIENLPRKGYRFIAEVEALTADELRRRVMSSGVAVTPVPSIDIKDKIATTSKELSIVGQRKVLFAIAAACLLVLLILVAFNYRAGKAVADPNRIESIAILPFENQNPDTEYLSDGLTECLIGDLGKLPKLRVINRTSVFQYKNKQLDLEAIGRELNVRAILTGSIEQQGENLTITTKLTDTASNTELWGQQFVRKAADIFSTQKEISTAVLQTLRIDTTGKQQSQLVRAQTNSPEAYDLYLRGQYYWNKRTNTDILKALGLFQQSVDKDPTFAEAYVGEANCYVLGNFGGSLTLPEQVNLVKGFSQRALEIDENLGEPLAALAINECYYNQNWKEAENDYRLAIERNPNYATAHHWYAEFLSMEGRFDESIAEYNRAIELDPLSLAVLSDLGFCYYYAHDYDRAIEILEKVKAINPDYERTYYFLFFVYREKGMFDESVNSLEMYYKLQRKSGQISDARLTTLTVRTAKLRNDLKTRGAQGFWQGLLDFEIEEGHGNPSPYFLGTLYLKLGDPDKAFPWLDKASDNHDGSLVWLKVSPEFDTFRSDPRFIDLMRRVGLNVD